MRRLRILDVWYAEIQRHLIHPKPLQPFEFLLMDFEEIKGLPNLVKQVWEVIVADHRHKS